LQIQLFIFKCHGYQNAKYNLLINNNFQIGNCWDFPLLPLSTNAAEIFGELKYRYKMATHINQENLKKHTIDFIIASIALSHNLTVISADKIYRDIVLLQPDFTVENWTA